MKPLKAVKHVQRIGLVPAVTVLTEQLWYRKSFFGLRCDLTALPPVKPAGMPVSMSDEDPHRFDGFARELEVSRGNDVIEVLLRADMCAAGIRTLYSTRSTDGLPAYAQWLVRAADQGVVHAQSPGRYRHLDHDEVLLEGAYTFSAFRRLGLMAHGMGDLLRMARDEGATAAFTYVAVDNVPSLRGCSAVGFDLDHVHVSERRLGRRRTVATPLDDVARAGWERATS